VGWAKPSLGRGEELGDPFGLAEDGRESMLRVEENWLGKFEANRPTVVDRS
jgi:hypothetical protein